MASHPIAPARLAAPARPPVASCQWSRARIPRQLLHLNFTRVFPNGSKLARRLKLNINFRYLKKIIHLFKSELKWAPLHNRSGSRFTPLKAFKSDIRHVCFRMGQSVQWELIKIFSSPSPQPLSPESPKTQSQPSSYPNKPKRGHCNLGVQNGPTYLSINKKLQVDSKRKDME